MKHFWAGLFAATIVSAAAVTDARAADFKPAILYDLGGKFDKSFNESAYHGAEKFKKDTGIAYRDLEISNAAQREQALRRFARDGNNPIISIGFAQAEALKAVAQDYPDTKFAIIDSEVDLPNVRSILFKEEEGSYLVGILAAMKSKSKEVGFVGGMDIPLISKFACGYKGGVKSVDKDAKVIENMTGTTGAAWNDPVRGGELAKAQIDQGADVIFHAAGGTGVGVLQAAADAGKLGIGVDSNQDGLFPGHVLTSMIKRVDNAVYQTFIDVKGDKWTSGVERLGLENDGVGYSVDEYNKDLITPEMKAAADKAKQDIIAGTIKVHDYTTDSACPY
ncbi:BMP family ABC transporter substrate-binding protein [Jiella sp. MQZ9-1]|uniref:BMP family ABC transporter substrate-binding protein n=1 Tax=Jiella flava TaxID=2816857 RepID=A0A939FZU1_9HYPH|nr:BMP family ABC transporter substrate-binding protein [Jiella flava]MBO0664527.1 BMP family ABC transporter substrate-binding protein [Jiella flava]MCD2473161.1 BMP family ABC transporter substrate-binding protein [Jiella flava]